MVLLRYSFQKKRNRNEYEDGSFFTRRDLFGKPCKQEVKLPDPVVMLKAPFIPGARVDRTIVLIYLEHSIPRMGFQSAKSGEKGAIFAACGNPHQERVGAQPRKGWGEEAGAVRGEVRVEVRRVEINIIHFIHPLPATLP